MSGSVRAVASEAGDHPVVEKGARLGFAASGLLHLLIAWVVVQLAWGMSGGGEADQEGALRQLAGNPLGSVLLWLTVVGFVFLAVWQVTEAVVRGSVGDRLKAAGKAVVYVVLAWTAFTVVQGQSGSQGEGTTATLMGSAVGRLVVAALGLTIIGVGIYHVVKGWTKRFLRDLEEHPGTWSVRAGRVGYVAKGLALVLVGGFFVLSAATADPDQPQGLDEALRALLALPAGPVLLTVTGLGFAAYGVYSFARARHGRV